MKRIATALTLSCAFAAAAAFGPSAARAADAARVLDTYADIAHAMYEDSLIAAETLRAAVAGLAANPSRAALLRARAAWIAARRPYQQTEGYRFGNTAVDEWEGKVNAWPLDEGLIDYVDASYGKESKDNPYFTANVIACQDQGPVEDGLPLVGLHRPGSDRIEDLEAPETTPLDLAGYCGSVAVDRGGRLAAISAPRGNRVLFWNTVTGELAGSLRLADGCGLAPGPADGTFALTSGTGAFLVGGPDLAPPATLGVGSPWDNHLLAVPSARGT